MSDCCSGGTGINCHGSESYWKDHWPNAVTEMKINKAYPDTISAGNSLPTGGCGPMDYWMNASCWHYCNQKVGIFDDKQGKFFYSEVQDEQCDYCKSDNGGRGPKRFDVSDAIVRELKNYSGSHSYKVFCLIRVALDIESVNGGKGKIQVELDGPIVINGKTGGNKSKATLVGGPQGSSSDGNWDQPACKSNNDSNKCSVSKSEIWIPEGKDILLTATPKNDTKVSGVYWTNTSGDKQTIQIADKANGDVLEKSLTVTRDLAGGLAKISGDRKQQCFSKTLHVKFTG